MPSAGIATDYNPAEGIATGGKDRSPSQLSHCLGDAKGVSGGSGSVFSIGSQLLLSTTDSSPIKFVSLPTFDSLTSSAMAIYVTSADGTKIWAEATGDPAKPAVVFIPGFSCTSLAFDKQWVNPFMKANLFMVRESTLRSPSLLLRGLFFPVRSSNQFVIFDAIGPIRRPWSGKQWPAPDRVRLRVSATCSGFQGRHRLLWNWTQEANPRWMVRLGDNTSP